MKILPIDFETYYSREFSLSKMTTEEYIRSPEFEVVGVSVQQGEGDTRWFSGTMAETGEWLRQFDWANSAALAHNMAFDGAILAWHFGIVPKLYLDTLSMAQPMHKLTVGGSLAALVRHYKLGEKGTEVVNALGKRRKDFTKQELAAYGQYCINDTELTYALFNKLKAGFPVPELMVIDQTMRMYTQPIVKLDAVKLQQHLDTVLAAKQACLDSVVEIDDKTFSVKDVLMSNPKFAALLEYYGAEVPVKTSPRTGKTAFAFAKTDKGMTDLLEHPDERVATAAAARLGVKSTIEETRTEALLRVAQRGTLPVMLKYYGAHTGRFSGGDKLNLQNLPKRGNTAIRDAIMAPDGHSFVACDLSQIEARMLAYIAGQDDLVQAFREGRDVYSEFASEVYGRKITKADKVERFVGKTCILGLGYGMGAEKFRRTLEIGQAGISVKIDLNEAHKIVNIYRNKNHKIVSYWSHCNYALTSMYNGGSGSLNETVTYSPEGIRLPNGFTINYPEMRSTRNGYEYIADMRAFNRAAKHRVVDGNTSAGNYWTKIYGGKVAENITQALAALLIREQMGVAGLLYPVVFQVHDEIVIVAPDAELEQAERALVHLMSQPPAWAPGLPVACESGVAKRYGEV